MNQECAEKNNQYENVLFQQKNFPWNSEIPRKILMPDK